jgi:hypothetical protein
MEYQINMEELEDYLDKGIISEEEYDKVHNFVADFVKKGELDYPTLRIIKTDHCVIKEFTFLITACKFRYYAYYNDKQINLKDIHKIIKNGILLCVYNIEEAKTNW